MGELRNRTSSEHFPSAIPDTRPQPVPRGGKRRKQKLNKATKVTKPHIKQNIVRRVATPSAAAVPRPSGCRKGADCFVSVPGEENVMRLRLPDTLQAGYDAESGKPTPNGQSSKGRKKPKDVEVRMA